MRVLSVPGRHPYVTAVTPEEVTPVRPDRAPGFAPDPVLEPDELAHLIGEPDLVHLHFGFDRWDAAAARQWATVLTAARMPLVLTVHDLRNPHHPRRAQHDGVLAALIHAATLVTTLTPGAAAEIAHRYGRTARVIPHPTLVDPDRTADVQPEPGLVGVALKSLRANLVDPLGVVRAVADGVADAGGRLRVDLHPEAVDDPRLAGLPALLADRGADLQVHPRFDDLELERYLRRLQVTVLPHHFGTHSGWLELARDLGTRVVAPSCGYFAEQWSEVVSYRNEEFAGFDPTTLRSAVAEAVALPPVAPADRATRLNQVEKVLKAHAELYAEALGR